jgi:hypothetical protein
VQCSVATTSKVGVSAEALAVMQARDGQLMAASSRPGEARVGSVIVCDTTEIIF